MTDHVLRNTFIGVLIGLHANGKINFLTPDDREVIATKMSDAAASIVAERMWKFTNRINRDMELAIKEEVLHSD